MPMHQPPKIVNAPVTRTPAVADDYRLTGFAPLQPAIVEYEEPNGSKETVIAFVVPGGDAYALVDLKTAQSWAKTARPLAEGLSRQIVERMKVAQARIAGAPPPPEPPPPAQDAVDVMGAG